MNWKKNIYLTIASLSGFIEQLLGKNEKPVLILDNVNILSNRTDINSLMTMLKYWMNVTFILVGNKMNNEFHFSDRNYMTEFNLSERTSSQTV